MPAATFKRGEVGKDEPDVGEYRVKGIRVARWIEHPFEWERYKRFAALREYTNGPLRRFWGGAELTPIEAGTKVRVFVEFIPSSPLFRPFVAKLLAPQSLERSVAQYQTISDFLDKKAAMPFPQLVKQRTPANLERLEAGLKTVAMRDVPSECVALLRELLVDAPDEDVAGMRPLSIAAEHGLDPQQTLETFLHATVAGLLEMRWEMLCPGCRGSKADATHLSELRATGHCEACNLDFDVETDELIEARFYPASSIRNVEIEMYCVGSPVKTPHRLLQASIEPREERTIGVEIPPGAYTLRSPQTRGMLRLAANPETGAEALSAELEAASIVPDMYELLSGQRSLRVTNRTDRRLTLSLDEAHTPPEAATPGRLMTLPAFQSLFSGEALGPGIELQVSRVGLLFTDLQGSTALYERVGDSRAFRLVSDHFELLRRAIEESRGALIKTVGDAVMAAFPDAHSAVQASLRIQKYILEIDSRGVVDPPRWVKVGVHVGACFAVTQNEKLDYFGTAVNLAARAQHEAMGGEIILTEAVHKEAVELIAGLPKDWFTVQLKGLSQPVNLVRVSTAPPAT